MPIYSRVVSFTMTFGREVGSLDKIRTTGNTSSALIENIGES
jgi:hypothetical protein